MALSTDGNNKVFVAVRDIAAGEELFGDYADYTMAVYYLKELCVNNKTTSQMANPGLEATTIYGNKISHVRRRGGIWC